jgi:hypothetical protein
MFLFLSCPCFDLPFCCVSLKSPVPVRQTPSAFHPHAQRNAFRRRDARLQSRSFVPENQSLSHSPSSTRLS